MVGNTPNYNKFDIVRCFLNINEKKSRAVIKQELELGEGTIRTILDILKQKKLILSTKAGHSYTAKGKQVLKQFKEQIEIHEEQPKMGMFMDFVKVALLYQNQENKELGIRERDIGIKNGAESVLLFKVKDGKLVMPNNEDSGYKFEHLEEMFELKENNVLIITMAETKRDAENSALAVVCDFAEEGIIDFLENI